MSSLKRQQCFYVFKNFQMPELKCTKREIREQTKNALISIISYNSRTDKKTVAFLVLTNSSSMKISREKISRPTTD